MRFSENLSAAARVSNLVYFTGFITDSGGSMTDYINTSLHTHYDTDFPELSSKLEKFTIGGTNSQALF